MKIQQQNTSFGAMRINRSQTKELLSGTPFTSAYNAAQNLEKIAIKNNDLLSAREAVLFQQSIVSEGKDSAFSEGETESVEALTRLGGDSFGHVMSYIRETHREAKEASDDKIAAVLMQKCSYQKPKEIIQVVADFIAGK